MGYSGWDDSGGRSRAPRDERPGNRSYDRMSRSGANGRGYERADRASARGWDDNTPRGSGGRPRPSVRDDDRGPGASSGSRWRGPSSDDSYDRPSRSRSSRDGYDGRGDRPDRSMRDPRPAMRDDNRDARPGRGAGPGAGPGGSNPRNRPPARPAWDDDELPRRRRPDRDDGRGRGRAGDPRDPRALRRGLVSDDVEDDDDDEDSGSPFGKAILIIFLAFLLGAGGAYGYFRVSTPVPQAGTATPASSPTTSPTPRTTPRTTPSAAPTATAAPTTLTPSGGAFLVMLPARAS